MHECGESGLVATHQACKQSSHRTHVASSVAGTCNSRARPAKPCAPARCPAFATAIGWRRSWRVVAAAHAAAAAANTRPKPHRPAASASSADHTAAAELGLRTVRVAGCPSSFCIFSASSRQPDAVMCVRGCVRFGGPPAPPAPLG